MPKKSLDKLNLTAKTIAEDMAENRVGVEESMKKLGMDPKKGLTKLTRHDILDVFSRITQDAGGLTGEQAAEVVRSVRSKALAEALHKGDMDRALWIADKIATDPTTGLTKPTGNEVTINIVESLKGLMDKPTVDIFKIEDNDDGK